MRCRGCLCRMPPTEPHFTVRTGGNAINIQPEVKSPCLNEGLSSVLSARCAIAELVKSIASSFPAFCSRPISGGSPYTSDTATRSNLRSITCWRSPRERSWWIAARFAGFGALAPARRQDGACLFLDEEHRCRIHSVSPYGCSHFDAHQTDEEANLRSSAGHYQVQLAWKNDHLYARLWLLLNALGRIAPSPVAARARMRAAIKTQGSSSFNHVRKPMAETTTSDVASGLTPKTGSTTIAAFSLSAAPNRNLFEDSRR